MVRIFVVYDSGPDDYEHLMAELVAEGVREVYDAEPVVRRVNNVKLPEIIKGDGLIIGGPDKGALMSWRLKKFMDDFEAYGYVLTNKVGGSFCCTKPGSEEEAIASMMITMMIRKMIFVSPDYKFGRIGAFAYGEPKTKWEKELCRSLGRKVAKVAKIITLGKEML